MQNVQNAAEIQQRVINLVELYRNKVGKNKHLINEARTWLGDGLNPIDFDISEELVKKLRVNEQLLGHFYSVVAGDAAEESVLSEFLADYYDTSIFSSEEEDFLCSHFEDLVDFIIQTPFDNLELIGERDIRNFYLIPMEVLDLIKSHVRIPNGSAIYNPFAGLTQMTSIFPDCKFYCEETYSSYNKKWNAFSEKCHKESNILLGKRDVNLMTAWMKVALYANSVDATIIDDGKIPEKYDSVISFIPQMPRAIPEQEWELDFDLPDDPEIVNKIMSSYNNLLNGGKMVLILPNKNLWASNKFYSLRPLWEKMISDKSLAEIIQLPKVAIDSEHEAYSIVIAEKGLCASTTTMMDVRFAVKETNEIKFFDLNLIEEMLSNGGKAGATGLRKLVHIPVEQLDPDCLIPRTYVVERPSKEELPVPLSELCTLENTLVREVKEDLPEDTPWVESRDLNASFRGNLDLSYVKKADCPNNPVFVEGSKDYNFYESGNFIDDFFGQVDSKKGVRVYEYRRCIYLDGTKDAVLFVLSKQGLKMAIVHAPGKPIAIEEGILTVCPKKGVDVMTLAASLSLPIVLRQLKAYKNYSLANHLDDILVPTDRRIIYDEISRMTKVKEVVENTENRLCDIKKSVRMRKHALTQSLSSLEAMFYALNAYRQRKDGHIADDDVISRVKGTKVRDAFEYLSKGLKGMMPVLEHIADVEYTFAKSEWIDPEKFIEDYIASNEKGWLKFKPVITWEKGHNQAKCDGYAFTNTQPSRKELALKKGQSIRQFLFPKDALEHVFKNIISNAQSWAFNDKSREDYQLKFSWHIGGEGKTLVIEIENNGTPIPEDRNTTSLLEYGVSTALHHDGHNGIGCNEIDDIMQRYDGKVKIVSTPQSTFTVKYVLTFNHINDMGK